MLKLVVVVLGVLAAITTGCMSSSPPPQPLSTPIPPGASSTPGPPETPPSNCPHLPLGGFADVWRDEQVYPRLGCAVMPAEVAAGTELYLCDGTHTLWLSEKRLFVVIPVWPHPWRFVPDESGLPEDLPLMQEPVPRPQPCFPITGRHEWLVRVLNPESGSELWARTGETAFSGAIQQFEGGWLFWNGDVCFVLFEDGTWTMF
jgi:hypothetical protein